MTTRDTLTELIRQWAASHDATPDLPEQLLAALIAEHEAETNPPLPDGFSRETCYVVACAACGFKFDEEEFTTVHFGSVTEATDEVRSVDWTVLTDGRVLCQVPDEAHRALRLLAEPDPDEEPDDAPTTADLFTGDELSEMERDAEFAMDAADDEARAEIEAGEQR